MPDDKMIPFPSASSPSVEPPAVNRGAGDEAADLQKRMLAASMEKAPAIVSPEEVQRLRARSNKIAFIRWARKQQTSEAIKGGIEGVIANVAVALIIDLFPRSK